MCSKGGLVTNNKTLVPLWLWSYFITEDKRPNIVLKIKIKKKIIKKMLPLLFTFRNPKALERSGPERRMETNHTFKSHHHLAHDFDGEL